MNNDTHRGDGGSAAPIDGDKGISKRDYFAGLFVARVMEENPHYGPNHIAQRAYEYADAMLHARTA